MPCKCIGWIICPSFMKRMRTLCPCLATIGSVAGNPLPLSVNPPLESLMIIT